jgi:drug/metabolite transporter (DMT)-like permease
LEIVYLRLVIIQGALELLHSYATLTFVPKKSGFVVSKTPRWLAYLYLLITIVLWGAALPIVKPALDVTTPFRYLFYRYVLAVVLTIPLLLYFWPRIKKPWQQIKIIIGIELICTTVSLGLLYFGLRFTTAIEAGLIGNMSPIFTTLTCVFFLREKEERHEWLGLLIAFVSTVIFALMPALERGYLPTNFSLFGNLLIFIQNIVNAFGVILVKKYYHHMPKFFVTTISFYVGLTTFGIFSLVEAGSVGKLLSLAQLELHNPWVLLAAVYMAIFGSIIALTTHIKGQDSIEASEASLFGYLQPLVYIPLSIWLLHETIDLPQLLPLLGVVAGVFIAEKRFGKKTRASHSPSSSRRPHLAYRLESVRRGPVFEQKCCQKGVHHLHGRK